MHEPSYKRNIAQSLASSETYAETPLSLLINPCASTGHEHAYERTFPVINGTVVSRTTDKPQAPINLVLGMGGADNSYMSGWIEPPPPWIAHREMTFGHGRITITSATDLHFEYVAVDGALHDEFYLTRAQRL